MRSADDSYDADDGDDFYNVDDSDGDIENSASEAGPWTTPGEDAGFDVTDDEIRAGAHGEEFINDIDEAEDRLLRRLADAHLYARLERVGFAGPAYEAFANELARYGLSVMHGWLHSGYIFNRVRQMGRSVTSNESELRRFATDSNFRNQVANLTVAEALKYWRTTALTRTGWRPDGGANLTTYFTGACVLVFPNQIRVVRREETGWLPQAALISHENAMLAAGEREPLDSESYGHDPGWLVAAQDSYDELLGPATPVAQQILRLSDKGYSQDEIAEMLGLSNARVVEGRAARGRGAIKSNIETLRGLPRIGITGPRELQGPKDRP